MTVRSMRAAVIFLSRIPAGGFPYSDEEFRAAPGHFPFVGFLVGGSGAAVLALAPLFGPTLTASLALLTTVWITGAFHEDGLADSADALGGSHSRKNLHAILKDSRIGTYGASALVFSLLVRTLSLSQLIEFLGVRWAEGLSAPLLFVLVHVLSRVGPVGVMASLPYVAGEGAKGSSVARGGALPQFLVALSWAALALLGVGWRGLPLVSAGLLVGVCAFVSVLLGAWFKKRAGGFTGDFLGATEQITELSLLLTLVAMFRGMA